MKYILFTSLTLLLCITTTAYSQSAVVSSGGNASSNQGKVSYSIGQVFYTPNTKTSPKVTPGVQQVFDYKIVETSIHNNTSTLSVVIYPNPTVDAINIKLSEISTTNCIAYLYDTKGLLILQKEVVVEEFKIDMDNLQAGVYILTIKQDNNQSKSFKIIKSNKQ